MYTPAMLAATLPMPPLPAPVRFEHFALALHEDGKRIEVRCWCGAHEAIETCDAWAGRCLQRFWQTHATCRSGAGG
jgi:hypothetical protein